MTAHTYPLFARQPIFTRKMAVYGYELLYRSPTDHPSAITDGDKASTQVLLSAFTDMRLQKVVGNKRAFINFTGALMDAALPFDNHQLVIEVLESEYANPKLLHRLKVLKEKGFTIALDDFERNPDTEPLVAYADIVKLDVLALNEQQLQQHLTWLQPLGVATVAEKIETSAMLETCKSLGFDYFQGYFLERPQVIKGRRLSENKQSVLALLAAIHAPEVEFEDIEHIISRDAVLSYKLLKLVNSAAFGLPRTIESLRQAMTLLGLKIIKNWVGLLAMSNLSDKPLELAIKALVRARFCELLAAKSRLPHQCDSFFTVGLLSTLDAFMDLPLPQLLDDIRLSQDLQQALLKGAGAEGKFLQIAIAYERGEWDKIDWEFLQQQGVDQADAVTLYLQTLDWVNSTGTNLEPANSRSLASG